MVINQRFVVPSPQASKVIVAETIADDDIMQPWFASGLRRTACEAVVRAANHGDFLVRESRGSDMYVLVVNDSGSPTSFPVTKIPGDETTSITQYVFAGVAFASLRALIKYLRLHPLSGKNGSTLQLQQAAAIDGKPSPAPRSIMSVARSMTFTQAPWYASTTSRAVVEACVLHGEPNEFLVRESRQGTHFVLCVNDNGAVLNFQIQRSGSEFSFGGVKYSALEDVIFSLRTSPIMSSAGTALYLSGPAPRIQNEYNA